MAGTYVLTGEYAAYFQGNEAANDWLDTLSASARKELGIMADDGCEVGILGDWIEDNGGRREWAGAFIGYQKHELRDLPPEIGVGTVVEPDGWKLGYALQPGLAGFCDYYLPTGYQFGVTQVAVNVKVTGRKSRRRNGGNYWRVQITFVGDGEPDIVHGGWVADR